ncbi:helix-turn-helix transcriptional regulator [Streptomyces sp. NBC_00620]|uniref:helix-turn-helix domain-containing protein n=1 Tax=Streptomyces sp. NBC_00620 TaxID=2903666 RepID=UPI0022578628|nr:helix-turn-helix transcriptional regulator [Streptomyces sp. NBC_00620]MCX4974667.1 helix-turn-helix transcriptional regulator [Streptomyces sp. NBC_00620]
MAKTLKPTARTFGQYVAAAARTARYDIAGSQAAGRKELAQATGMSQADVGRMLTGQLIPQIDSLKALAVALDVGHVDMLVAAGVLDGKPPKTPAERPLAAKDAARRLGIRSPQNVAAFEVLVAALVATEPQRR